MGICFLFSPLVPYDRPLPTTLSYNLEIITLPISLAAAAAAAANQSQSIPGATRLADLRSVRILAGTLSLQRLILKTRLDTVSLPQS